jgi:hypothetical protein
MNLRLSSACGLIFAIALAIGSFGGVTSAHADYYHHGHHYHHRYYVRGHGNSRGYYRYN